MFWLLLAWLLSISPAQTSGALDVSTLKVSAPVVVAELDLGSLKGELRQIGWSPDRSQLYVQTAEGNPTSPKLHHYVVTTSGGAIAPSKEPPSWAQDYWLHKSDRFAPGIGSLFIDVDQKFETMKYGTGSAGAIDQGDRATGGLTTSGMNAERAAVSDKLHVVRLMLVGEAVSEFVNEAPVPGLMFGWGPAGSGRDRVHRSRRPAVPVRSQQAQGVGVRREERAPAGVVDRRRAARVGAAIGPQEVHARGCGREQGLGARGWV
jgi:hypothetical protein